MLGSFTNILKKVLGDKTSSDLKELTPIMKRANEEFAKLSGLSNDELRSKTASFKTRINDKIKDLEKEISDLKEKAENGSIDVDQKEEIYNEIDSIEKKIDESIEEVLEEIMPAAFAVAKETAKRFVENETIEVEANDMDRDLATTKSYVTIEGNKAIWKNSWDAAGANIQWNMVHYDVQLIGGAVLHKGRIAEMQTGEGKTLVATLPIYLNALAGRGVHLVTVNDYLARRDSEWMGPFYEFHGLTIDCIDKHEPHSPGRIEAYKADITYGTNNEFGFDYLRDNMSSDPDRLVQRKHHFAIVDEVDSVLIDDARTPLIISGPTPQGDKHEFVELKPRVERLVNAQRKLVTNYISEAKKLLANLEGGGVNKEDLDQGSMDLIRGYRGLPKNKALIKFLSEPGIRAHLQKTENHYLQDQSKEMPKVDAELYFVIDEKQNAIELTDKGIDLISNNPEDANFFILPDLGTEMVAIEKLELEDKETLKRKDELIRDYSIKAERIHSMNQLLKAYTLFENDVEYVIMEGKVKIVDEQTGRIMEGRRYSDGLHQAIEAKENVTIEAATQTYATVTLQNYFRMYHKLAGMTGTAETEAKELWDIYELDVVSAPTNRPIVRDDAEDRVYKTKREKFNAVIEEVERLRNAGRPVLVGTTSVEVSELLGRMLKLRNIPHNVLNAKLHQKEADIVAEAGRGGTVTISTNMAGRGTDIKLGEGVKEAGGLAIIGTERHDSRRVDRQLRGRSGRQGDPGSSQFYVCLEDNLMRLFGSERIAKLMDRMGLEEGEVIQHSMITKSIERAQRKVEENNFGVRKHLLEYDDVMNVQREVIYKKRKHALFGERLGVDIANMFYDVCANVVELAKDVNDYESFKMDLIRVFSLGSPIEQGEFTSVKSEDLVEKLFKSIMEGYDRKKESITNLVLPTIKSVYEGEKSQYSNIQIPITDGVSKALRINLNLEKAYNTNGKELFKEVEKGITLAIIDDSWKEHLRDMDDLRQSVQQARYEQKDPLLIYKLESFELFKKMINKVNHEIVSFLFRAGLPEVEEGIQGTNAPQKSKAPDKNIRTNKADTDTKASARQALPDAPRPKPQPVVADPKIGRNDPCPCGSGKKYKQCHGV